MEQLPSRSGQSITAINSTGTVRGTPNRISGTVDGLIDRRTPDEKGFIVVGGATIWRAGMRPTSKENHAPDLNITCIRYISDRPVITALHVSRYNLSLQYIYI
jgi:hypothetical protein